MIHWSMWRQAQQQMCHFIYYFSRSKSIPYHRGRMNSRFDGLVLTLKFLSWPYTLEETKNPPTQFKNQPVESYFFKSKSIPYPAFPYLFLCPLLPGIATESYQPALGLKLPARSWLPGILLSNCLPGIALEYSSAASSAPKEEPPPACSTDRATGTDKRTHGETSATTDVPIPLLLLREQEYLISSFLHILFFVLVTVCTTRIRRTFHLKPRSDF